MSELNTNKDSGGDKGVAYALIDNWDEVLLNKARLLGSRLKITTQFTTVGSDGTIWLSDVNNWCSLDDSDSLRKQVLSLKKYAKYTFCGILQLKVV